MRNEVVSPQFKLLERAKRAETSAEDATARASAADASLDAVRESAATIRAESWAC